MQPPMKRVAASHREGCREGCSQGGEEGGGREEAGGGLTSLGPNSRAEWQRKAKFDL